MMDRILFGDNQFFGVNHMSEDKARLQSIQFRDIASIMRVLDYAYDIGIKAFMCTTHDRIGEIAEVVRADPARYAAFEFYPGMPYAHKYANSVGEVGILETIRRVAPGGVMEFLVRGTTGVVRQNMDALMRMLVDAELSRFDGTRHPIVFMQNVVTDLLLGLGFEKLLVGFAAYVRERYKSEAGFITMNLPLLVDRLESAGLKDPIVCATINKIGFRMSGGIERYREVLRENRCRAIAMSVFASGAIRPEEAIDWVCGLAGVQSIVFGASTPAHIKQSKELIESAWGFKV